MNNAIFYSNAGRQYAYFPVIASLQFTFTFSVRKVRSVRVINGDGTKTSWTNATGLQTLVDFTSTTGNSYTVNQSPSFTGDIKIWFPAGLKDLYSLHLGWGTASTAGNNAFNIPDYGLFLDQFPNLYSLNFDFYGGGNNAYRKRIYGDLSQIPDSIIRYRIQQTDTLNSPTQLVLNLSNFSPTSRLEYFNRPAQGTAWDNNNLRVIGDLAKIPRKCAYFQLESVRSNSVITYTAGKIWPSVFNRLLIRFTLSTAIIDNILKDMAASVTSSTGSKQIYIIGTRSTASDVAVNYLQGIGFSITLATP